MGTRPTEGACTQAVRTHMHIGIGFTSVFEGCVLSDTVYSHSSEHCATGQPRDRVGVMLSTKQASHASGIADYRADADGTT